VVPCRRSSKPSPQSKWPVKRSRPRRTHSPMPATQRRCRLCRHEAILPQGLMRMSYTDRTVGYRTLQSVECLISLGKATAHIVYPTVLAVTLQKPFHSCQRPTILCSVGDGIQLQLVRQPAQAFVILVLAKPQGRRAEGLRVVGRSECAIIDQDQLIEH